MILILDLENLNLKKRIEQFKDYKKSGKIFLKDDTTCFLEFHYGEIVNASFKDLKDIEKCEKIFLNLKRGKIVFNIQDEKNDIDLINSFKDIGKLKNYLIFKDGSYLFSYSDEKLDMMKNYILLIKKNNFLKGEVFFFKFEKSTLILILNEKFEILLEYDLFSFNKINMKKIKRILNE